uniref:Thiol:disulfide interchange protein n=1 Tax=Rhodochorton tenue TaxID=173034 RepID=UPI002A7EB610|nr:Thiol:disulfide interchange protein [Rhodochorton tenue]WOK79397.1 Thiol:disulfide interchange protein [Rhodochorton tenue]
MNIHQLELSLYSLQQYLNNFLLEQLNSITILSFCTVLTGGILTSFNPCMLSSIPIAIASINTESQKNLYTFFFILGILSSFIIVSFITLLVKTSYGSFVSQIPILAPIILVLVGLSVLNIINLSLPSFHNDKPYRKLMLSVIEIYTVGFSVGINLSPCATPILMTVITWISSTHRIFIGCIFLCIYIIGYILPLIISISSINYFKQIKSISTHLYLIVPFFGYIIISMGSFALCHELLIFSKI